MSQPTAETTCSVYFGNTLHDQCPLPNDPAYRFETPPRIRTSSDGCIAFRITDEMVVDLGNRFEDEEFVRLANQFFYASYPQSDANQVNVRLFVPKDGKYRSKHLNRQDVHDPELTVIPLGQLVKVKSDDSPCWELPHSSCCTINIVEGGSTTTLGRVIGTLVGSMYTYHNYGAHAMFSGRWHELLSQLGTTFTQKYKEHYDPLAKYCVIRASSHIDDVGDVHRTEMNIYKLNHDPSVVATQTTPKKEGEDESSETTVKNESIL